MEKLNKKYIHYIKQNIQFIFLNSKKGKQRNMEVEQIEGSKQDGRKELK